MSVCLVMKVPRTDGSQTVFFVKIQETLNCPTLSSSSHRLKKSIRKSTMRVDGIPYYFKSGSQILGKETHTIYAIRPQFMKKKNPQSYTK